MVRYHYWAVLVNRNGKALRRCCFLPLETRLSHAPRFPCLLPSSSYSYSSSKHQPAQQIRRMLVRAGSCTTSCFLASFLFAASTSGFVPFQSTISRFYGIDSPPRYFFPRDNKEHISATTLHNGDPRFNYYSWARWASESDDDDQLEPVDQESINNATMNETLSSLPPDESPKSSSWRRWNPFRRKVKEPGPKMEQLPQANNNNKTITTTQQQH